MNSCRKLSAIAPAHLHSFPAVSSPAAAPSLISPPAAALAFCSVHPSPENKGEGFWKVHAKYFGQENERKRNIIKAQIEYERMWEKGANGICSRGHCGDFCWLQSCANVLNNAIKLHLQSWCELIQTCHLTCKRQSQIAAEAQYCYFLISRPGAGGQVWSRSWFHSELGSNCSASLPNVETENVEGRNWWELEMC